MDSMDRRVQKTEAALGQGSSQASSVLNTLNLLQIVLYLTVLLRKVMLLRVWSRHWTHLRGNESLQSQVDKCLAELERVNETATKGRNKSQHEGPGEVSVKRMVDWPQNFILTRSRKNTPTYDDLTLTQWVARLVRRRSQRKPVFVC